MAEIVAGEGLQNVTQLALGGRHMVACTHGGRVATFGANDFGLLGLGSHEPPNPFQPSFIPDLRLEQASLMRPTHIPDRGTCALEIRT